MCYEFLHRAIDIVGRLEDVSGIRVAILEREEQDVTTPYLLNKHVR